MAKTNDKVKCDVEYTVNLDFIASLLRGDTCKMGRGEVEIKLDMVEIRCLCHTNNGNVNESQLFNHIKGKM
jgi:hypothetical protein